MTRRISLGIRGRLLVFLGAAIVFIVALQLLAQTATSRVASVYEERLEHYHLVHRMRIALTTFRSEGDRYLRDPSSVSLDGLYTSIASLAVLDDELKALEDLSMEAGFEVRATGYGLDAYLPRVSKSFSLRAAGRSDYYADFAAADHIAAYIDTYLSRLLTILMKEGEERFREVSRQAQSVNDAILLGIVAAGLLLFAYIYAVANSITKPIRQLAKASERLAAGDLSVPEVEVRRHDEVRILAKAFRQMSESISAHMASLREKAELERRLREEETSLLSMGKALKEAQFMNLQDQMRPHFLFNALNAIARNALLEGARTTERLTISLARLLRSTMKEGGPYVSLNEEVDTVREYLGFQKARFGSRLEWEIHLDPDAGDVRVPRFLLQPLVENAVRHGVEPLERPTRILVSVHVREGEVRARVVDSGIGMSPEVLAAIRAAIRVATGDTAVAAAGASTGGESASAGSGASDRQRSGIGLANLAQRLNLVHGEAGRLRIHSLHGKGTIVRLDFPLKAGQR